MFRWTPETKEQALDMLITGQFSLYDIEEKTGASRYYITLLQSNEADFITQERKRTPLTDITENSIIDLYDEDQAPEQIAETVGVTVGEVRRTILIQCDEWNPADDKAAGEAHLALLHSEHPDRLYEEDLAALTEYAGQGLPMRGRTIEAYLP